MMTKSIAEMKKEEEEHADTPTVRVLYEIILEMNAKMVKMEARLDECEKWSDSNKRKLNVIGWLNERYNPYPVTYTVWFNTIKLTRQHLEMIFEMDYVMGISSILQSLLPATELPRAAQPLPRAAGGEGAEPPAIKCFNQKDNILFIYENDKWDVMPNGLFDKLIMTLSKKLIGEFFLWQNENIDKLENDAFATLHAKNLKKVMGGSVSIEILSLRVKKEIYKYLKTDVI